MTARPGERRCRAFTLKAATLSSTTPTAITFTSKSREKRLQKEGHYFMNVDGKLMQLMTAPLSDFLTREEIAARSDSTMLQKHMKFELANFEKIMNAPLNPDHKLRLLSKGRLALIWSFKMPKRLDNVSEQLFFSTITKNHVLILNGIISNKSDYKELSRIMEKAFKSLTLKNKPVDEDDFGGSAEKEKSRDKDD
jgi:hypothetical protein